MRSLLLPLMLAAIGACHAEMPRQPPRATEPGAVACAEPRPQVCTREYRPVCGVRADDTRQTFGNACTACAEPGVVRHVPGPCR